MTEKLKPKEKPHYVNNKQFSLAVVDYVNSVDTAKENDQPVPGVPNYIANCFMKICEGLSHKSNFVRYTYRDEMVMDAVENCLKAIYNYNIEAATRTGLPNAFAYFTQISYYAFLRRIAKEKKQQDIRTKFIAQMPSDAFLHFESYDESDASSIDYVDYLRERIFKVKDHDAKIGEFGKECKKNEDSDS